MEELVASSREGAARWLAIHDELLRGLTHALSNRVATISAVAQMIGLTNQSDERSPHMLRVEADQLEHLLHLLRLLPRYDRGEAEPIMASDAARSAIELHTFHPTLRDIACELIVSDDLAPAWADPSALQHAIVVALTIAKRSAGALGATQVHISSTPDIVRVDVVRTMTNAVVESVDIGAENVFDINAAHWLVETCRGRAFAIEDGCRIEITTLASERASRQR